MADSAEALGCVVLEPVLFEKVWGGDRLAALGKRVAPGASVGESWELADMPTTSASGAGGGAVRTAVRRGSAPAGVTVGRLLAQHGRALLGGDPAAPVPAAFPLLVKYLDARQNLSVQVHPSAAYAAANPGAHLKTECWHIVDAEPGAVIYKGVRPGVDRARFEAALRHGDGSGVVGLLGAVPAVPGQCHNLPSGTVHALGAGVVVAEVQTPSDTTFRVYDWGRAGRQLHVDQALACVQFEPARDAASLPERSGRARLVSTGFFVLDGVRAGPGEHVPVADGAGGGGACVVMLVRGAGRLIDRAAPAGDAGVALCAGDTALVPAAVAQRVYARIDGAAELLIARLVV
ncbi:MAG: hypothetical protein C0475_07720 [Planctomyces sp.]|nr:hypothetical protein [Planctomyces sp.]MBA4120513.1 hypothetical protein [Isosphaera sp.]